MKKLLAAILAVVLLSHGNTDCTLQAQESGSNSSRQDVSGQFIVHEWGTFTTFSGSDGVFLDFRPLAVQHKDLPPYVLDRGSYSTNISRLLTKSRLWGRVRMETPVTYFYTDRVRTVDVQVDFPQGLLTEFYPPVTSLEPPIQEEKIFQEGEAIGKSSLVWKQVNLLPTSQIAPSIEDETLRQHMVDSIAGSVVPHASNEDHYAAARQTDSALIHVRHNSQSHFEKFLFYRGVGKFDLPIRASFAGQQLVVENLGGQPLRSLIAINVQGKSIEVGKLEQLAPKQKQTLPKLAASTAEELAVLVVQALVQEGLYEKEAKAMVSTWQQSWFTENGTRVLYMVPTSITEELLPLRVSPTPQESVRVLVGRFELMSPEMEKAVMQSVALSSQQRAEYYAKANPKVRVEPFSVPKCIIDFGRMAEPALIRISKIAKDQAIRQEAETLIAQIQEQ